MNKFDESYSTIEKYKKDKKLTFEDLGKIISMNGDQLRMALKRKSLSKLELDAFTKQINEQSNENNFESDNNEPQTTLFKTVPFYNINVSAGDAAFLDDGVISGQSPDGYMQIPVNVDADVAFPTFGHSMYPEISNGDRVAYKFIKDWSFFNYGMKYLIITKEQRMVKYLKKHPKEGYVLLESRNKDYEPIDMPIDSIVAILQVRYIGKIEM
ncbi:S24 family peptidase [Flavobacterium agricola]|uniref:S24 family peptidase n=1 Tax=Flavobacterium agricola TaxID=2870839 RepID=A0ABY6M3H0_9FLAO|nr:S24 family peptidase [Flavobacterium agricola]UYW01761.1 S24 family peptidase [Flavobacterium agricola]